MEPSKAGCTVNLCEETHAALIKRAEDLASPGKVVDVMLQRYFDLMYLTLGNLWQMFTNPEMCLLIEVCGASCPSEVIPSELQRLIRYGVRIGRAKHLGVHAGSLLKKVGRLTPVEWLALVDISQQAFADKSLNLRGVPAA